jgi:hypothetical protein
MLMKVKRQDWDAQFGYAPPRVDAVLNTEDVVSAVPCESRGQGPWMRVTFRSGAEWIVWGTPDDLTRGFVVVWVVERFCGSDKTRLLARIFHAQADAERCASEMQRQLPAEADDILFTVRREEVGR